MSGQIFISYRREESQWSARSLYDRLTKRFDRTQIFMDVDAIALGEDFLKAIEKRVGECDVLIAVIGAHWLTSKDEQGNRRLDDPEDFVRMEIATALKRDIRVIPVLVDGALMPRAADLPDDLKRLVHRNALQIGNTHFDDHCRRLTAAIEQVLEKNTAAGQLQRVEKERLKNELRKAEKKERLETKRRQKEEQKRLENKPQSSPPGQDTSVSVDPPLGEKAFAELEVKTDYPTATRYKADVSWKDRAVPVEPVEGKQPRILSALLRIGTAVVALSLNCAVEVQEPFAKGQNSIGMRFVEIPGTGTWWSIWETRVADFKRFIKEHPEKSPGEMVSLVGNEERDTGNPWQAIHCAWDHPEFKQTDDHPVVGVSFDDARAFCDWLNEKERAQCIKNHLEYRLPTDEEWQVAAAYQGTYPWGNDFCFVNAQKPFGNYAGKEARDDKNWPKEFKTIARYSDEYPRTSPVGTFAPNRFGLFDMDGNVSEWCSTKSRDNASMVVCGASWCSRAPEELKSTAREVSPINTRNSRIGFRVIAGRRNLGMSASL